MPALVVVCVNACWHKSIWSLGFGGEWLLLYPHWLNTPTNLYAWSIFHDTTAEASSSDVSEASKLSEIQSIGWSTKELWENQKWANQIILCHALPSTNESRNNVLHMVRTWCLSLSGVIWKWPVCIDSCGASKRHILESQVNLNSRTKSPQKTKSPQIQKQEKWF